MKVQLKGNLTRDAKILTKKNGNTILVLSVAENYNRKNADGSWTRTGTSFRYCIAYSDELKNAAKDFRKGQAVLIDGFTSILPATDNYPEHEQIVIQKIEKREYQKATQTASGICRDGYEPLPGENALARDYVPLPDVLDF